MELSVCWCYKLVFWEIKDVVDSVCFIVEYLKKDDKENLVILDLIIYMLIKLKFE